MNRQLAGRDKALRAHNRIHDCRLRRDVLAHLLALAVDCSGIFAVFDCGVVDEAAGTSA